MHEIHEEQDIQIDINISSYIPDSYIDSGSQKIEVYQNIALCRNEEDIQNTIDELIDRYGVMPRELENLLEVARIKELARKANIIKVAQRRESIVFYFDKNKYNPEIIPYTCPVTGKQAWAVPPANPDVVPSGSVEFEVTYKK